MKDRLIWERDGGDWPNRSASQFVVASGIRFHVQRAGQGPGLLLVHGTGASTHSWRDVLQTAANDFDVVAMDLPGHGFTQTPEPRYQTLPGMAQAIGSLLTRLNFKPEIAVGHSAGAAILLRMALDRTIRPRLILSFNGALLPFHGFAGKIFSPLAKMLALNPLVPWLAARRATDRRAVERLLEGTGSKLSNSGVELYQQLFESRAHISGTLAMMARWDLVPLIRDLPALDAKLVAVAAGNDLTVSPTTAHRVAKLVPSASVVELADCGHLAHEEQPSLLMDLIGRFDVRR